MPTFTGADGTRLKALLREHAGLPSKNGRHPDGRIPVDDPARGIVHEGTVRFTNEPADTITTDSPEVTAVLTAARGGRSRLTLAKRAEITGIINRREETSNVRR